jgi:stringent starvation protein B
MGCVLHPAAPNRWSREKALYDRSTGDKPIYDDDNGDDEQQVDETTTHVHYEETENPQDKKNYRDRPKHYGILARSELRVT